MVLRHLVYRFTWVRLQSFAIFLLYIYYIYIYIYLTIYIYIYPWSGGNVMMVT